MARVPKTRNHHTMTERAFWGRLKTLLRGLSMQWKPAQEALKRAEDGTVINPATGRENKAYKCAECGERYMKHKKGETTGIQKDHIDPIVPKGKQVYSCGEKDYNPEKHICLGEVATSMYVEIEGFQALCFSCNAKKSNREKL